MIFPNKITELGVASFGKGAGLLTQPANYNFTYAKNIPISLTMNTHYLEYNYGSLHPIFAQNLPEGRIKEYLQNRLLKTNKDIRFNDMYMLALQFDRGIGHLSYASEELEPLDIQAISLKEIIKHKNNDSIFADLLDRYYLNGVASGMQPKVLVPIKDDSRVTIQQKDYILKTFDSDFPLLTVNEFVCMEAARACGLAPPKCYLSEDLRSYLVERFDVTESGKLGLEDFTVLTMARNTADAKYQSSYEVVLEQTRIFTNDDPLALRTMYSYITFNCLIGNGDAHLKNFSLSYTEPNGVVSVSPPYDITHTRIKDYLIKDELALKFNGTRNWPTHQQLLDLGQHYGINKPENIIEHQAQTISDFLKQSEEVKLFKGLRESIEKSLSTAKTGIYTSTGYVHKKNKKFD